MNSQFLNSVLSNIGKPGERTPPVTAPVQNKRKVEEEIVRPNGKALKTSQASRPNHIHDFPARVNGNSSHGASFSSNMPYRETVKESVSAPATPTEVSIKQLKKGSFQEIMARRSAAKASEKPVVGTISHKTKQETAMTHKKELKLKKKALHDKKLGRVSDSSRPSSSDGRRDSNAAAGTIVKDKRLPQPSYSGTAKPKPRPQPSYKGTMGARATSAKLAQKAKPGRNANAYAGTDDELDSYGEDEGGDYGYSGEESDMEAGFTDVEHEESTALKLARREDEEQLALENELKKVKKRKLDELARNAKPRKY